MRIEDSTSPPSPCTTDLMNAPEVGASGTVRVLEPQAQRAIHADVGQPDQPQRDGTSRPGDDSDHAHGGGGSVGVGQVVGHGTGTLAPQAAEQAEIRCRATAGRTATMICGSCRRAPSPWQAAQRLHRGAAPAAGRSLHRRRPASLVGCLEAPGSQSCVSAAELLEVLSLTGPYQAGLESQSRPIRDGRSSGRGPALPGPSGTPLGSSPSALRTSRLAGNAASFHLPDAGQVRATRHSGLVETPAPAPTTQLRAVR
jgi:hypothetical protein